MFYIIIFFIFHFPYEEIEVQERENGFSRDTQIHEESRRQTHLLILHSGPFLFNSRVQPLD